MAKKIFKPKTYWLIVWSFQPTKGINNDRIRLLFDGVCEVFFEFMYFMLVFSP